MDQGVVRNGIEQFLAILPGAGDPTEPVQLVVGEVPALHWIAVLHQGLGKKGRGAHSPGALAGRNVDLSFRHFAGHGGLGVDGSPLLENKQAEDKRKNTEDQVQQGNPHGPAALI